MLISVNLKFLLPSFWFSKAEKRDKFIGRMSTAIEKGCLGDIKDLIKTTHARDISLDDANLLCNLFSSKTINYSDVTFFLRINFFFALENGIVKLKFPKLTQFSWIFAILIFLVPYSKIFLFHFSAVKDQQWISMACSIFALALAYIGSYLSSVKIFCRRLFELSKY